MRPEASAYDHLAEVMPTALPEALSTRLGSFGFGQEKAFVPVTDLSGGERARLNLALVTHDAPSLLILDEPTKPQPQPPFPERRDDLNFASRSRSPICGPEGGAPPRSHGAAPGC